MFKNIVLGFAVLTVVAASVPAAERTAADTAGVKDVLGNLPLYFIENGGQVQSDEVAFYVKGSDKTLFFTSKGVTLSLQGADQRWTAKLEFVGANPDVKPSGEDKQPAIFSYFKGRPEDWKTALPTYRKIVYADLWPGIDLVYSGNVNELKYELVVEPGADPRMIRLAYRGITAASIEDTGALKITTPAGCFEDGVPYAYQVVEGKRKDVSMRYRIEAAGAEDQVCYGFDLREYDRGAPLVLDPSMLLFCGYIGGSRSDTGTGIAVDGEGNAYVAGYTTSSEADGFPVQVGPDLSHNGFCDAFVAKVSSSGDALLYCGYIGGSDGVAQAYGIAVDGQGNAFVTGGTTSSEAEGFPVVVGPDLSFNGGAGDGDAFVAKVSASGTSLVYCGYIGGASLEKGNGIAVDGQGNAYVTGDTSSSEADGFPVAAGPDLSFNGGNDDFDAFVAKVSASGTSLVYCGYIGGSESDQGYGVAVDAGGTACATGITHSSEAQGFPAVVGPDLTYNGLGDAFVAKVSASGTSLVYCGYVGGSDGDLGYGIAVDVWGNVYVAGTTGSTEAEGFPVVMGPDLSFNGGHDDAFVAKVSASGASLDYCGYVGGSGSEQGCSMAVDARGNAYATGQTQSSEAEGFPVVVGPDLTYNGFGDAFVANVSASGASLVYCGYVGGSQPESGAGIAIDSDGNAYLTGATGSTGPEGFPVVVGPDLSFNGYLYDAFVAKVPAYHVLLRAGNVATGTDNPADVLFVNRSTGDDAGRTIVNPPGAPISIGMLAPPGGPSPAAFALYVWYGEAGAGDPAEQPYGIGTACFPMPLSVGMPWGPPATLVNNIGSPHVLGIPLLPNIAAAPTRIAREYTVPAGTWTIQGIIYDADSGGAPVSLTNAIVLVQQ